MATIGDILKSSRLEKGLDTSEVSRTIRMKQSQLEALERNDFSAIPAPVYVRGFLKQYAQFLGIDSTPLITEYNAILAGGTSGALTPSLRPAGTGPEPRPTPPPPEPKKLAAESSVETVAEPIAQQQEISFSSEPAAPSKALAPTGDSPPHFQPIVIEHGAPELLQPKAATQEPEKPPAWKDPVVIESGRIVKDPAAGGEAFRSSEQKKRPLSGHRKQKPVVLSGRNLKIGAGLVSLVLLTILIKTCGSGRSNYSSIEEVPFPDNPVLYEPAEPYMPVR